jgi:hypothetical protein
MWGSSGSNSYWWTEGDAAKTIAAAMGTRKFEIKVPEDTKVFTFSSDDRFSGGTWISSDAKFSDDKLIAHVTMTIDRLAVAAGKDDDLAKSHATLLITNLHYTVRRADDSQWIELNADTVLPWVKLVKGYDAELESKKSYGDQKSVVKKAEKDFLKGAKKLPATNALQEKGLAAVKKEVAKYQVAQTRSVHGGLVGSGWNSGNKSNTSAALEDLGFQDKDNAFLATLPLVGHLIVTALAQALKGLVISYPKDGIELKVASALVKVNADIQAQVDG